MGIWGTNKNMQWLKTLAGSALACVVLAYPVGIAVAQQSDAPPVLTVDEAVHAALANNRNLKIVSLGLDSSKEKLAADKTHRLPSFNTYVFGSQLLAPITFNIAEPGSSVPITVLVPFPQRNPDHHPGQADGCTSSPPPRSRCSRSTRSTCISGAATVGGAGRTEDPRAADQRRRRHP